MSEPVTKKMVKSDFKRLIGFLDILIQIDLKHT